jgi:hypothetical protein
MESTPGAPASAAERADALGLAEYQLDIYDALRTQPDSPIPLWVLPILARWLDKIDFNRILVGRAEAAAIISTGTRNVTYHMDHFPQWLAPLVSPAAEGSDKPAILLWLRAKVRGYARWRESERIIKDLGDLA